MKLTARQLKFFDELSVDKLAAEATLKVALQFHNNTLNEIAKKERELWNELSELHGLDLVNKRYSIASVDGQMCLTEIENK